MNALSYTLRITLLLLLTLGQAHADNTAAISEILKLQKAGVGQETIVAFIKGRNTDYNLSTDGIIALREQGVTSAVLNAMLDSGRAPGNVPATLPGAAIPQVDPVLAPSPTPVYPGQNFTMPGPQPLSAGSMPGVALPPAVNPDVAYFYQELSPYGRWILAEDNQYYWQPTVAATNPEWRPYWDSGQWSYTDHGWYWRSSYPWGWAPFHYGRWQLHPHHGWVWLPDRVWGPAWVVWRTGGDFSGWAPLPPGAVYDIASAGFTYRGIRAGLNFDFGLDWLHFNFCYTRELGEPIHARFRKEAEVRNIFRQTTVINNFTVGRSSGPGETQMRFFNHGIDPDRVGAIRGHRIDTITIEDSHSPPGRGGHENFDARNKVIEVYRPHFPNR